jgi:ferredoxin
VSTHAQWIAFIPGNEDEFATDPQLYIDPVECIDSGACVPVCAVSAIFALDEFPAKWDEYTKQNADHYVR